MSSAGPLKVPGNSITLIPNALIDRVKWDACMERAPNGLIYGYSWYLDHMAEHWDGLVLRDYEAVMPLTWNRKYGVAYLYQPFLCAQLGIFGDELNAHLMEAFLKCVPSRFKYWDIYLNHGNVFPSRLFHCYERRNFVLDLSVPYEETTSHYRENLKRNIKKAGQVGNSAVKGIVASRVADLAMGQSRPGGMETPENISRFLKLVDFLKPRGQAETYGIVSAKGELLASCILLFSHNRAYYILVGNHPDGRTIGASHALVDFFIRDLSGKNLLLDFEGSDIRNLAFFYSSFGAREERFAGIKQNKLPFYLKWLKD